VVDSDPSLNPFQKSYLDRHPWQEEVIQSFLPTLIMALLALLIPLLLLLIGKKAQTTTTLSAMHDTMMSRYYKFLVVNVLIFFCVGTAAVQSFLVSFKKITGTSILNIVADSFPSAGPFYVGWRKYLICSSLSVLTKCSTSYLYHGCARGI
jgi:hypothetical protein